MSPTETTDAAKTDTKKDIKREISVEIPAAEVARETEVQIQRYQKSVVSDPVPQETRDDVAHFREGPIDDLGYLKGPDAQVFENCRKLLDIALGGMQARVEG